MPFYSAKQGESRFYGTVCSRIVAFLLLTLFVLQVVSISSEFGQIKRGTTTEHLVPFASLD